MDSELRGALVLLGDPGMLGGEDGDLHSHACWGSAGDKERVGCAQKYVTAPSLSCDVPDLSEVVGARRRADGAKSVGLGERKLGRAAMEKGSNWFYGALLGHSVSKRKSQEADF